MKKYTHVIYLIICLALVGCTQTVSPFAETTSTRPAATSKSPTLEQTEPAPIVTSTATQIIIPPIEKRCLQSAEEPFPALQGQLVLAGFRLGRLSSWTDGQSYLYNLQDSSSTLLGTTRYETVSSNGDLLAYYEKSSDLVVISEKEGNIILTLPADNSNLFPAYWIDNQRLVLNKMLEQLSRADFAALLVIDPFTNQKQEWLPEFHQQDHDHSYGWKVTSNLIFNPSLNRLVYPVYRDKGLELVLRDLDADREIARIYNGAYKNTPQWSPDGSQFIISAPIRGRGQENFINIMDNLSYVGGSDLLLISRDGQIKRLTYFTVTSLVGVTDFVWSPDGQKIAFLLWDVLHSHEPSLMVVDIETGIVSDYCKLAEPPMNVENIPVSLPDPVWSPDGRYLVFTEISEEYQYKVRLLELESGKAWDIAEDVSAMGWMMTP